MRASSATASPVTGIMIPLYVYPGSNWDTVAAVQQANPAVPIVAIINPNNGPGGAMDALYASGIKALQAAGVTVLGYVHTSYGSRSLADVKSEINSYHSWYSVTGIFLDEMANQPGSEGYYSGLTTYIKSLGFTYVVGNPGADTTSSYVGTVDTIVIYENQGLPSASYLGGWHSGYAKSNFAMMAYAVANVDAVYPSSISPYVSYIYVTNAGLPNPYDALPPYLATVATDLVGATATTTTTTSSPGPTTSTTAATTATSTATVTTTKTVTSTATVTSLTTITSTLTGTTTATSVATTTSTATAMTTTTQTATTTATRTANVTTTRTGTETATTTVTATATTTTISTETATTTVAATVTTAQPAASPAAAPVTVPAVVPPPSQFNASAPIPAPPAPAPSPAAMVATPAPAARAQSVPTPSTNNNPFSAAHSAVAGALAGLESFLAAEAQLFANAINAVGQGLRLAFSGL